MAIFYEKKETENEILYIYKYSASFYYALLFAFLTAIPDGFARISYFVISPIVLLFCLIWIVDHWKPNRELRAAMKKGKVEITGSKFSFKNPLTCIVKK